MTNPPAVAATNLGKRYRRGWALRSCSFAVPPESVVAMVGPNGAGKSTMMSLAAGLMRPTSGRVEVLGNVIAAHGPHPRLAFLSQDHPLYRRFTVEEMLHFGRAMNAHWDDLYARRLVRECDIPMTARTESLSAGQRARVALALALGRRPAVLLLDEPLAALDPLARTQVLRTLLGEVASTGITVVLSSHVIADIEDVCDRVMLLASGQICLDDRIEVLLDGHRIMTGPAGQTADWIPPTAVVESRSTARQTTVLLRDPGLLPREGWTKCRVTLDELVLAYLRTDAADHNSERTV